MDPSSFRERGTVPKQGRTGQIRVDAAAPFGHERLVAHRPVNVGKGSQRICGTLASGASLLLGLRSLCGGNASRLFLPSGLFGGKASSLLFRLYGGDALGYIARSRAGKHRGLASVRIGGLRRKAIVRRRRSRAYRINPEQIYIMRSAATRGGEAEANAPSQHARCAANRSDFGSYVRLPLFSAFHRQNFNNLSLHSARPLTA